MSVFHNIPGVPREKMEHPCCRECSAKLKMLATRAPLTGSH